jgi:hypothetical protein
MTEQERPAKLPDWISDHLARYLATDGADGYLWDASLGGGQGMIPTLLLTTVGRRSGRVLTMPLTCSHGQFRGANRAVAQDGRAVRALRALPDQDRPADSGGLTEARLNRSAGVNQRFCNASRNPGLASRL